MGDRIRTEEQLAAIFADNSYMNPQDVRDFIRSIYLEDTTNKTRIADLEAGNIYRDMPVASATVIEVGDLVYLSSNLILPASSQEDQASPAGNQELFHDSFVGVAQEASADGETEGVNCLIYGTATFTIAEDSPNFGELFGPNENVGGDGLLNDTLIAVATPNLAVGRSLETGTDITELEVFIISTIFFGGPQVAA